MDQGIQTISAKTLRFPARQGSAPRGRVAQDGSSIFRRSPRTAGFSPARERGSEQFKHLQKVSPRGRVRSRAEE